MRLIDEEYTYWRLTVLAMKELHGGVLPLG
jgi:hypothetical protein